MNKKFLPLSALTLILIIALTSCNRQNVPEFAAGRFHHKEKSIKHADETTLALQQREKLEPIKLKTSEELQSLSQVDENLKLISKNDLSYSTKSVHRKTNKLGITSGANEVSTETSVASNLNSEDLYNPLKQPVPAQMHPGEDRALCAIIAIFIPFLGVGLYEGITVNFWIDLLLTFLFYFPGLIFALIVILSD